MQAGETSGFIADEARRAMLAAIDHCSPGRTTAALLHANLTRNRGATHEYNNDNNNDNSNRRLHACMIMIMIIFINNII